MQMSLVYEFVEKLGWRLSNNYHLSEINMIKTASQDKNKISQVVNEK